MPSERKRSWKEIDASRDRKQYGATRPKDDRSQLERALDDPRLKDLYLKEAEKLFMGAKGSSEHAGDLQAVHDAYGTAKFEAAVQNYLDRYGLPEDWGTLMLLLDFKSGSESVCRAIEALIGLAETKGTVEKKGLKSKLKVLSLTSRDTSILEAAEDALAEMM